MLRSIAAAIACAALTAGTCLASGPRVDENLPSFEPVPDISGNLRTVGSDTMNNLAGLWAEAFRRFYPAVRIQVESKGSSTGPPALMENQAQFAPMSRAFEDSEVDQFVDRFGYEPTSLRVAIDCIGVFVHKDCPLDEISMDEILRVFSVAGPTMTWGDLGVTESGWRDRPVSVYGRNSASGTYKFFKDVALEGQDFKPTVREMPGSAGVVAAVATDAYGIGYSGVGFLTPDVKLLRVSFSEGEPGIEPAIETANSGEYPIARFLYVYLNYDRRRPLDPLRAEFVRMLFSEQGQEAVIKDGAFPVSADVARQELEKVGLEPDF